MPKKYPPGPTGSLIFGIAGDFLRNALESLQKAAPYGDIVHFRVLHKHLYFLNHPDYIHQVLVGEQEAFYKEAPLKQGLYPLLGNGIILKDGEDHRRARRRLQPAFYHKRLVSYAQTMLDKTEQMLANWRSEEHTSELQSQFHLVCRLLLEKKKKKKLKLIT